MQMNRKNDKAILFDKMLCARLMYHLLCSHPLRETAVTNAFTALARWLRTSDYKMANYFWCKIGRQSTIYRTRHRHTQSNFCANAIVPNSRLLRLARWFAYISGTFRHDIHRSIWGTTACLSFRRECTVGRPTGCRIDSNRNAWCGMSPLRRLCTPLWKSIHRMHCNAGSSECWPSRGRSRCFPRDRNTPNRPASRRNCGTWSIADAKRLLCQHVRLWRQRCPRKWLVCTICIRWLPSSVQLTRRQTVPRHDRSLPFSFRIVCHCQWMVQAAVVVEAIHPIPMCPSTRPSWSRPIWAWVGCVSINQCSSDALNNWVSAAPNRSPSRCFVTKRWHLLRPDYPFPWPPQSCRHSVGNHDRVRLRTSIATPSSAAAGSNSHNRWHNRPNRGTIYRRWVHWWWHCEWHANPGPCLAMPAYRCRSNTDSQRNPFAWACAAESFASRAQSLSGNRWPNERHPSWECCSAIDHVSQRWPPASIGTVPSILVENWVSERASPDASGHLCAAGRSAQGQAVNWKPRLLRFGSLCHWVRRACVRQTLAFHFWTFHSRGIPRGTYLSVPKCNRLQSEHVCHSNRWIFARKLAHLWHSFRRHPYWCQSISICSCWAHSADGCHRHRCEADSSKRSSCCQRSLWTVRAANNESVAMSKRHSISYLWQCARESVCCALNAMVWLLSSLQMIRHNRLSPFASHPIERQHLGRRCSLWFSPRTASTVTPHFRWDCGIATRPSHAPALEIRVAPFALWPLCCHSLEYYRHPLASYTRRPEMNHIVFMLVDRKRIVNKYQCCVRIRWNPIEFHWIR